MVLIESRKWDMSGERISRSEDEMWPFSWAVTISITEWSSGGRLAAFDGRSEREAMRNWDARRLVRDVVRLCGIVSL